MDSSLRTCCFRLDSFIKGKQMQETAGYGTIIRQEICELSARVALTIGDAARVFRLIEGKPFT